MEQVSQFLKYPAICKRQIPLDIVLARKLVLVLYIHIKKLEKTHDNNLNPKPIRTICLLCCETFVASKGKH
jgi:hypothetical protein